MDSSTLEKQTLVTPSVESHPVESHLADPQPRVSLRSSTWASWFFLAGSLTLVVDAIMENYVAITLSSLLHLAGSLLFTLGSVLLIPRRPR